MKRTTQTIVRTAVLALALINQLLTALGKGPLPIEDDQLEALAALVITAAGSLWAWWKNNSVTAQARMADAYLDELQTGKKRWRHV